MICAMVSLRALALVQLSTSWRVHVRHCDVCIAHVYRTPVPFNVCLEGGWAPSEYTMNRALAKRSSTSSSPRAPAPSPPRSDGSIEHSKRLCWARPCVRVLLGTGPSGGRNDLDKGRKPVRSLQEVQQYAEARQHIGAKAV